MKCLIDAQLPLALCRTLTAHSIDPLHTSQLPLGNRTPDDDICALADDEDRVVVSKDADFVTSHLHSGTPRKLLLVSTGNITNDALIKLFNDVCPLLPSVFASSNLVELTRGFLVIH